MNAAHRAKAILGDPGAEWASIESEAGDPAYVLSHYVAVLALVPAVFSFIGACAIGVIMPICILRIAATVWVGITPAAW